MISIFKLDGEESKAIFALEFNETPYLFLYSSLITFIIFIVCIFIDLIRHLISILLAELFNKINFSKIKNFSSKVYEKIRCLIFSNDDNQIE